MAAAGAIENASLPAVTLTAGSPNRADGLLDYQRHRIGADRGDLPVDLFRCCLRC